jgi:P-type Ca2+ transporter type 2C
VAGLDARLPRVEEVPFSSERKLMSTVHRDTEAEGQLVVFTKGAPDALLPRCSRELVGDEPRPLDAARREAILAATDGLADRALRTLAVAVRRLPRDHRPERGAPGRTGSSRSSCSWGSSACSIRLAPRRSSRWHAPNEPASVRS